MRIADLDPRKLVGSNGKLVPLQELPDDVAFAIAGIEIEALFDGADGEKFEIGQTRKLKFNDRQKALTDVGRSLGYLTDKLDVNVKLTLEQLVAASMKDDE